MDLLYRKQGIDLNSIKELQFSKKEKEKLKTIMKGMQTVDEEG